MTSIFENFRNYEFVVWKRFDKHWNKIRDDHILKTISYVSSNRYWVNHIDSNKWSFRKMIADSAIIKINVVKDKFESNAITIVIVVKILLIYDHFKWIESNDFKMSAHESTRFKSWLDQTKTIDRLTREIWKKRTWIEYVVLFRLMRAYFTREIEHDTINWNVTIAKCLSMIFVSNLCVRIDDVVLSQQYKNKSYYVQYRHIELFIEKNKSIFVNFRVRITIEFEKNHKKKLNFEKIRHFRSLVDEHNNHMCSIALFLVHCFRHSFVVDKTLQKVLDEIVQRFDRTIVWLFSERSVLAIFSTQCSRCQLDKSVDTMQLLDTIKKMKVVIDMLDRAYDHAFRFDVVRDVAHLFVNVVDSIDLITNNVRQNFDHNYFIMNFDVTEIYIDESSLKLYNVRAFSSKKNKSRKFRFVSLQNDETNFESRDQISKILAQTISFFFSTQFRRSLIIKNANASLTSIQEFSTVVCSTISESDQEFAQCIDSAILDDETIVKFAQAISEAVARDFQTRALLTNASSSEIESLTEEENILLNQFNSVDVEVAASEIATNDEIEEKTEILFYNANREFVNVASKRFEKFVEKYVKYNVSNQYFLDRYCQLNLINNILDDFIDQYCQINDSRDRSQSFVYYCKKTTNCSFKNFLKNVVKMHENNCTNFKMKQLFVEIDKNKNFVCSYNDCIYACVFTTQKFVKSFVEHIRIVHKYESKFCEHQCESNKFYYSLSIYNYHIEHVHSRRWSARCTFSNCNHDEIFANHSVFKFHLQIKHNLNDENMMLYFSSFSTKQKWIFQICFIDDCNAFLNIWNNHIKHFRLKHDFNLENAQTEIATRVQFEMIVLERKFDKKKISKRQLTVNIDVSRSKKKKTLSEFSN